MVTFTFQYNNGVNIQVFITSADSLLFTTENLKYSFLSFRHLSRTLLTDDMSKREECRKVQCISISEGF